MALSPTGGRQTKIRRPAPGEKHIPGFGSSEGTRLEIPQAYFGCSFSAAELMQ
jgi:hypothetical protein